MRQISFIFNSKTRKGFSILFLLIGIFVGVLFLNRAVMRDQSGFKYRPFFEQDTEYDVLFFGTSHVINGIFPMQLWKDYGITSYNFGGHGNIIPLSYHVMLNAIEYHKPKIAVLDVYYAEKNTMKQNISQGHLSMDAFPLTKTKWNAIRDVYFKDKKSQMEMFFPFSVYHNRWKEWNADMVKAGFGLHFSSTKEKGAESRIGVAVPNEMLRLPMTAQLEERTLALDYIEKFIQYCWAHSIEPVLINIPYPASEEAQKAANAAMALGKGLGVRCINYQYLDLVDFDIDCYDSYSHLNPSGARKISDHLGRYLTEKFELEDHRKEVEYQNWNQDYQEYVGFLTEKIKNTTDYKSMLMLLNNQNFRGELEVTEDYVPDRTEKKLMEQLGNHLVVIKKASVETEKKQEGTVKLTVFNRQTNELLVSRVYKQNEVMVKD